jgi:hypothetical protein
MVLLLTIARSVAARVATTSKGRRTLDEANAALAAQPFRRETARRALEAATTATTATGEHAAVSEAYLRLGALYEEEAASRKR